MTCREALALAFDLSLTDVLIASGCQGVVKDIQGSTCALYASIIKEINITSRQLACSSFIFEGKETNHEAHSLVNML